MQNNTHKRFISTPRLTMNALLIAVYIVLDMYSVYIGNYIKLTFAPFPLLVAAMLFGTMDGVLVAGIGELIYQMILYGPGPTTVLWLIPPILHALIVGLYAKRHNNDLTTRQTGLIVLISGLVTALVTTFIIYLDAKIIGYPSGLTAMLIFFRFVNSLIMCVIYTLLVPRTVHLLKRIPVRRTA